MGETGLGDGSVWLTHKIGGGSPDLHIGYHSDIDPTKLLAAVPFAVPKRLFVD